MTDLQPHQPNSSNQFPVLAMAPQELAEVINENLGGDRLTPNDLDRIKVPAGGAQTWEIPSLTGGDATRELEGIIVYWTNVRAYWPGEYAGGNEPPQCSSPDGVQGYGDPGILCAECPHTRFREPPEGRGQACKAMRNLFLVVPGSFLPMVVTLPPTSLKNARTYFTRLAGAGAPYNSVVTRLTLGRASNPEGQAYSKVEFHVARQLDGEDRNKVKEYADSLRPILEAVKPDHSDPIG